MKSHKNQWLTKRLELANQRLWSLWARYRRPHSDHPHRVSGVLLLTQIDDIFVSKMSKHKNSIDTKVLARFRSKPDGWVAVPADFADLGSRDAVASALKRHKAAATIRQWARGLYGLPRRHELLGDLHPSTDELAAAIARRTGAVVRPVDIAATNMLGLSTQVVAKPVYETNGPSRRVKVGPTMIEFRHRSPRKVTAPSPDSGLVFAALRGIGKTHVTQRRVARLRTLLPANVRAQLMKDLPLAPVWMHPYLRYIAEDPPNS